MWEGVKAFWKLVIILFTIALLFFLYSMCGDTPSVPSFKTFQDRSRQSHEKQVEVDKAPKTAGDQEGTVAK